MTDDEYREAAASKYGMEVDERAEVMRTGDGAFVAVWVWVDAQPTK